VCNGIWFTGKSFGVFRDTLREFDLSKIDFAPGFAVGRTEFISSCPRCEEVLSPFRYAYNSKVHLNRCEKCKGLWLPFPEFLNVLDLAKVGQDIAPHVTGVAKEMARIQAELDRDRRVTNAMKELKKPVSPLRAYGLYRFSILLPLYDNVERTVFPIATIALIGVSIVVFLAVVTSGAYAEFNSALGLVPANFPSLGSVIPTFAHMFMHGGLVHLFMNMFFLWMFGDNVEERLGTKRYVIFYLFCGVVAALAQITSSPSSELPMVGASGAISGVLGAYLVLFPHATVTTLVAGTLVDLPTWVYFGLWFLLQFIFGMAFAGSDASHIAWWAHIGGFMAGLLVTWLLVKSRSLEGSV